MRRLAAFILLALPAASQAQTAPERDASDPRVAVIRYVEGRMNSLNAAPDTALSILLDPLDPIQRVQTSDQSAFDISVPETRDSLVIFPLLDRSIAIVTVTTQSRSYSFEIVAAPGLAATPLVRFEYDDYQTAGNLIPAPASDAPRWSYRVRGDSEVRPELVEDDGLKTYITYSADQYLPAVFAIGPTGDEEVVDGYMRGELFVIDRVHEELVFRIDREKATAKRRDRKGD